MTEQRCGTCRRWDDVGIHGSVDWGFCERIQPGSPWTGNEPAWLTEVATLGTRADFGCVLWEPHDTEGPT